MAGPIMIPALIFSLYWVFFYNSTGMYPQGRPLRPRSHPNFEDDDLNKSIYISTLRLIFLILWNSTQNPRKLKSFKIMGRNHCMYWSGNFSLSYMYVLFFEIPLSLLESFGKWLFWSIWRQKKGISKLTDL